MKKTYLLLILSLLPFLLFAETNSTTCILPTTILFKSGMKDTAKTKNITTLQMILYANGYLASKPTGSFGPATKKAVEAFQKEKKLKVTGITGKYTIDELNTLGCASYSNSAPTQITTKKVTIAVPSNNEKIISASSSLSKITEISNNKVIKNTSSQDTLTSNLKTITVSTVTQSVEVKPKDSSVNSVTIESLSADDKLKIEEDIKNVNGTEKDMTALVKLVLELKTLQKKRYDNFYTAPTTKSGLETDYALVQQIGSVESKIDSIYFAMRFR